MKTSLHSSPPVKPAVNPLSERKGLQEEIRMLRSIMQQVAGYASSRQSLDELLKVLDTFSSAATRLAKLLATEQKQAGEFETIGEIIALALNDMIESLKREE